MYDLYAKLKDDDERIYNDLIRLHAQLRLHGKSDENFTDYELPYIIGILENRLGIREWHGVE